LLIGVRFFPSKLYNKDYFGLKALPPCGFKLDKLLPDKSGISKKKNIALMLSIAMNLQRLTAREWTFQTRPWRTELN
jgi:hypothetical protein